MCAFVHGCWERCFCLHCWSFSFRPGHFLLGVVAHLLSPFLFILSPLSSRFVGTYVRELTTTPPDHVFPTRHTLCLPFLSSISLFFFIFLSDAWFALDCCSRLDTSPISDFDGFV